MEIPANTHGPCVRRVYHSPCRTFPETYACRPSALPAHPVALYQRAGCYVDGRVARFGISAEVPVEEEKEAKSEKLQEVSKEEIDENDELAASKCIVLSCLNAPELDSEFIKDKFSEFAPTFKFIKRLDNVAEFVTNNEEKSLKNLVFSN